MARPTTDLAEWLGRHGLGQYVQTFAENNIEYSVLPDLTEDDLEKLGVSLGHRKKLLRAIEALTAAGQRTGTTTAVSNVTEVSPTRGQHREAEFRQITVMFCDLVGSTQLSQKLDPEDLQDVIRHFLDACSQAIGQFNGYIAKYMGDGMLIYFGYPQAHENDAERAVHSGVAILDAVKALNQDNPTQGFDIAARIGIATGQVVVGELCPSGGRARHPKK